MVFKRWAAVAIVAGALGASGLLLGESLSGTGVSQPSETSVTATAPPMPLDEIVVRAADGAALAQLCLEGLTDPELRADYERARDARPNLATRIGPDCRFSSTVP